MSRLIDITRKRFGKLLVVEYLGNNKWQCKCDCGKELPVYGHGLRHGFNKSCGCLRDGRSKTPEYHTYSHMIQRCSNPKDKDFHNYGGRGIKVCRRWMGNRGFDLFLKDMGRRPHGSLSIDRKNSNGNYTPSNCRWATPLQQGENTRRTKIIEHNGIRKSMRGWAAIIGVSDDTIAYRIKLGQTIGDIIRLKKSGAFKDGKPRLVTFKGKTLNHVGWAKEMGIPQPTFSWQMNNGWTIEEIAAKAGY